MKKILITSIGRTGTKSLSYFLNSIPNVTCFHHREGAKDLPFLFLSQLKEFSTITNSYLEERDSIAEKNTTEYYIEVNPYLRFANAQKLHNLGWTKVFIVRHPKTYLESVYIRSLFTEDDYIINQYPSDDDPFSESWSAASRFEKLCWYYKKAHSYILESNDPFFRFEELTKNSVALKTFVTYLGIDTSKVSSFSLPNKNTSRRYKVRQVVKASLKGKPINLSALDWNTLTQKEKHTYSQLCEPFIKQLGYVL